LAFFIKHGLCSSNWSTDIELTTLFVINGHQCEVIIPTKNDIYVLKEDNCSDYEGWYNGINYMKNVINQDLNNIYNYIYICIRRT